MVGDRVGTNADVTVSPNFLRRLASCASVAVPLMMFGAHPAHAQNGTVPLPLASRSLSINAISAVNSNLMLPPVDWLLLPEHFVTSPAHTDRRPRALLPLYLSFASLQVLDIASTHRALERGAHEANPIVAPLTSSTPALIAVKAGSTAALIYLTERLRKRHPLAAVVLMVGLNAGYASLVAHNYSVK